MKGIQAVVAALALIAAVDGYAYQDGDFQVWHTEAQEFSVAKGWRIPLEEEFRYGNDASELYYHHYDAGVAYDVSKNLIATANYRQIWEGEQGKLRPEYRPYLQVIPKWDMWVFAFENRNRLEYRMFDYKDDIVRYRNRIMVKLPMKFDIYACTPYVANEVFADLDGAIVRQNRFSAGIILDIAQHVRTEVYYMVQDKKKSGRWANAKILGLKLKVVF